MDNENLTNEHLTWAELKEACNKIPEAQLNEPVRWWGEERGGKVNSVYPLHEDYVSGEEGWEPKSIQEVDEFQSQEDIDNMVTMPKGFFVLSTD